MNAEKLLEVRDLKTHFFTRRGVVKAVDGVSFSLHAGETLGLVGESGSGKSVTCFSIMRLVDKPAGRIVGGQIIFDGEELLAKSEAEMTQLRGKRIAMILQDPMASLDPIFTIGSQVSEPIIKHQAVSRKTAWEKAKAMLTRVHIPSAEVRMKEFPHMMSGGMRQRIVGAIGMSCQPQLLIADEPTTSLDVTVQAQFLRLLKELQQQTNVSMIMVTHDLGVVARVCDRVAVMYAGRIVEITDVRELFNNPTHPYTVALIKSLPKTDVKEDRLYTIEGQPPELHNLPRGCPFAPRCPKAMDICRQEYPSQVEVKENHYVSCHLFNAEGNI